MKIINKLFCFTKTAMLCDEYSIKDWEFKNNGSIDVKGDVIIIDSKLTKIPLTFNNVNGSFILAQNQIENMDGSPQFVGKDFVMNDNKITSLINGPKEVLSNYIVLKNKLTNLLGSPKTVNDFNCMCNSLSSLRGCPEKVNGNFYCSWNGLTFIDHLPKIIVGGCYFGMALIGGEIPTRYKENKIISIYRDIDLISFSGENGDLIFRGNPIDGVFKFYKGNLRRFIEDINDYGFFDFDLDPIRGIHYNLIKKRFLDALTYLNIERPPEWLELYMNKGDSYIKNIGEYNIVDK